MVREHGTEREATDPSWRLVVSPAKGIISLDPAVPGDPIATGATIASVSTLRDTYAVVAPHGGQVLEWLVEDGDPVAPGQPVLRLYPSEV
jgi:[acyl-carrier-protein] S-malonyltransferase